MALDVAGRFYLLMSIFGFSISFEIAITALFIWLISFPGEFIVSFPREGLLSCIYWEMLLICASRFLFAALVPVGIPLALLLLWFKSFTAGEGIIMSGFLGSLFFKAGLLTKGSLICYVSSNPIIIAWGYSPLLSVSSKSSFRGVGFKEFLIRLWGVKSLDYSFDAYWDLRSSLISELFCFGVALDCCF